MSSNESYRTKESSKSSGEEAEPLMTISDVIGLQAPETVPQQEEVPKVDLTPYEAWQAAPSPDTLSAVVDSLAPTISSVVASMGGSGDPRITARARVIAAKAVQTYDPEHGASLPTWVTQQERQLSRDIRKSRSVLTIPDGVKRDAYAIYRAEAQFEDEHGKEPTLEELADVSKISVKRIQDVRRKMMHEGQETASDTDTQYQIAGAPMDFSQEAMDYVYPELDRKDKLVLEYMTGYNGHRPKDNKWIMQKLGLNDVQMSRRRMRIITKLREAIEGLEQIQA